MPHPESFGPDGLLRGRIVDHGGQLEVQLAGELDLASADAFEARLLALAAECGGDVTLDCGDLEFLGSTGIRALIGVSDGLSETGRTLILRNVHGAPRRVLELTAVIDRLTVR